MATFPRRFQGATVDNDEDEGTAPPPLSRISRTRSTIKVKDREEVKRIVNRIKPRPASAIFNQQNEERDKERKPVSSVAGADPNTAANGSTSPCNGSNKRLSASTNRNWCELPEVVSSGILPTMTPDERRIQEIMYEVLCTEESFQAGLGILINHFMSSPELDMLLSKPEKQHLFLNAAAVKKASERFLSDLYRRYEENIKVSDICDIIYEHSIKYFDCYIKYCSNLGSQERMLKKLRAEKPEFERLVDQLENSTESRSLRFHSYLILPMTRITRIRLLTEELMKRQVTATPQYMTCHMALDQVKKVAHQCNEGKRLMEERERLFEVNQQLRFRELPAIPLISDSRRVLRVGEVTEIVRHDRADGLYYKNIRKIHFFLFTDLLVIATKRSDDAYNVIDHCCTNRLMFQAKWGRVLNCPDSNLPEPFMLSLIRNHKGKPATYIITCNTSSEKEEWIEAISRAKEA